MAGKRKVSGKPLQSVKRQQSRTVRLIQALGEAATPVARVSAISDYARAVVKDLPGPVGEQLAADLVATIRTITDRVLAAEGRI